MARPLTPGSWYYLSDLVHPNKGNNLILLAVRDNAAVFDVDSGGPMGLLIFDRIFPYAASLCIRALAEFQPILMLLGAEEETRKVNGIEPD